MATQTFTQIYKLLAEADVTNLQKAGASLKDVLKAFNDVSNGFASIKKGAIGASTASAQRIAGLIQTVDRLRDAFKTAKVDPAFGVNPQVYSDTLTRLRDIKAALEAAFAGKQGGTFARSISDALASIVQPASEAVRILKKVGDAVATLRASGDKLTAKGDSRGLNVSAAALGAQEQLELSTKINSAIAGYKNFKNILFDTGAAHKYLNDYLKATNGGLDVTKKELREALDLWVRNTQLIQQSSSALAALNKGLTTFKNTDKAATATSDVAQRFGLSAEQTKKLYADTLAFVNKTNASLPTARKAAEDYAKAITAAATAQAKLNGLQTKLKLDDKVVQAESYLTAVNLLRQQATALQTVGVEASKVEALIKRLAKEQVALGYGTDTATQRLQTELRLLKDTADASARLAQAQRNANYQQLIAQSAQRQAIEQKVTETLLRRADLEQLLAANGGKLTGIVSQVTTETIKYGQGLDQAAKRATALADAQVKTAASTKALTDREKEYNNQQKFSNSIARKQAFVTAAQFVRTYSQSLDAATIQSVNLQRAAKELSKTILEQGFDVQKATQYLNAYIKEQQQLNALQSGQAGKDGLVSNLGQLYLLSQITGKINAAIGELSTRFKDFEFALTEVRKTSGATKEAVALLGNEILSIAQDIPLPVQEIAQLAGVLGQVGAINFDPARQSLAEYVNEASRAIRLVSEVAIATDLSAQQAAEAFGQLAAIFADDVARLRIEVSALTGQSATTVEAMRAVFGVLNEVSNQTVATVEDLRLFIQNFGGVAASSGLAVEAVAAFGGTIRDLGISSQVAGTALSRLFGDVSSRTKVFAEALGVTEEAVETSFGADPQGTILRFFEVLNRSSTGRRNEILKGLAAEQRFRNTILKLADGYDVLNKNLSRVSSTATNYGSIASESQKFTETFAAQVNKLSNAFTGLSTAFEPFFAVVGKVLSAVAEIVTGFTNFAKGSPIIGGLITNIVGFGAAFLSAAVSFRIFRKTLEFAGIDKTFASAKNAVSLLSFGIGDLVTRSLAAKPAVAAVGVAAATTAAEMQQLSMASNSASAGMTSVQTSATRTATALKGAGIAMTDASGRAQVLRNSFSPAPVGKFSDSLAKLTTTVSGLVGTLGAIALASNGISELVSGNTTAGVLSLSGAVLTLTASLGGLLPILKAVGAGIATAFGAISATAVATVGVVATAAAGIALSIKAAGMSYSETVKKMATDTTSFADDVVLALARVFTPGKYFDLKEDAAKLKKQLDNIKLITDQTAGAARTLFSEAAKQAGASERSISRTLEQLAAGTLTLSDAYASLTRSVENNSAAFKAGNGVIEIGTNFLDAQADRARDLAIALSQIPGGKLDTEGGDPLSIRTRENDLIEKTRAGVEMVLKAKLQEKLQDEDKVKTLIAQQASLKDLINLADQYQIAVGFDTKGGDAKATKEAQYRYKVNVQLEEYQKLLKGAEIAQKELNDIAAEGVVVQKTFKQVLGEINDKTNNQINTVAEVDAALKELSRTYNDQAVQQRDRIANETKLREIAVQALPAAEKTIEVDREALRLAAERVKEFEEIKNKTKEQTKAAAQANAEFQTAQLKSNAAVSERTRLLQQVRTADITILAANEQLTKTYYQQLNAVELLRQKRRDLFTDTEQGVKELAAKILKDSTDSARNIRTEALKAEAENGNSLSAKLRLLEQERADEVADIRAKGFKTEADRQESAANLTKKYQDKLLNEYRDWAKKELDIRGGVEKRKLDVERDAAANRLEDLQKDQDRIALEYEKEIDALKRVADAQQALEEGTRTLTLANGATEADKALVSLDDTARNLTKTFRDLWAKGVLAMEDAPELWQKIQKAAELAYNGIKKGALDAGRALGLLADQQAQLQKDLESAGNTEKTRFASGFLKGLKATLEDRAIGDIEKGFRIQRAIEEFKRRYDTLSGEGPKLDTILTVTEQLITANGKRLQSEQDIAKAADDANASYQEKLKLTKQEQADYQRLLRLRQELARAEEMRAAGGVTQTGALEAEIARLEEKLAPVFGQKAKGFLSEGDLTQDKLAGKEEVRSQDLLKEKEALQKLKTESGLASKALDDFNNEMADAKYQMDLAVPSLTQMAANVKAIFEALGPGFKAPVPQLNTEQALKDFQVSSEEISGPLLSQLTAFLDKQKITSAEQRAEFALNMERMVNDISKTMTAYDDINEKLRSSSLQISMMTDRLLRVEQRNK